MTRLSRLVACWGNGQHGRLGHGGTASELFPRVVAALSGGGSGSPAPAAVAAGGAHTAVVAEDGTLWTFGINGNGQLGHSDKAPHVVDPTEAILPDAVTAVAAGESHTLALSASGEVWAAGSNADGQLGLGPKHGQRNADFRLIKALQGVRVAAVAAGNQHSLALADDGRVFAWGHGHYGALGLGPTRVRWEPYPVLVAALSSAGGGGARVRSIAAGAFHSGAVDDDGRAWLWGHGGSWQLGLGLNAHECLPQRLQAPRGIAQLALGFSHSICVGRHGDVASWGTDENGSLGGGWKWPKPGARVPEPIAGGIRLRNAAAGWKHSAGVDDDGRLYTWGWGGAVGSGGFVGGNDVDLGAGQLGHGDDMDVHEPKQVWRLLLGRGRYRDLRQPGDAGAWRALGVACARNHTAALVEVPGDVGALL